MKDLEIRNIAPARCCEKWSPPAGSDARVVVVFTLTNERSVMTALVNTMPEHAAAERFFVELSTHLASRIQPPEEVEARIRVLVSEAKHSKHKEDKCKAFPEGAFLNHFVLPGIYDFLKLKLQPELAREALLSESYASCEEIASNTPASAKRHPFTKVLGATAKSVVSRW